MSFYLIDGGSLSRDGVVASYKKNGSPFNHTFFFEHPCDNGTISEWKNEKTPIFKWNDEERAFELGRDKYLYRMNE